MNACNFDINTALHLAVVESKDLRQIKTLIDNGAEINKQNCHGNTALHLCLLHTERFSLMTFDPLAFGTATETNVQPLQSHTITVNANLLEDYDIAETLINEGADLNIQNNDGNTPLHLALIHSKASNHVHKLDDKREDLNKQCDECVKMFNLASQQSNVYKLVKKMIDKGADVGKQNREENTALHLALSSQLQLLDAVYEMFERQVKSYIDLLEINDESESIRYHDDFEKLLDLLLKKSETMYIRNILDMDPVWMTIDFIKGKHLSRYQQIFSLLMTFGPLLTYSDCYGNTLPPHYKRFASYLTKSFNKAGADMNACNIDINTALHLAVMESKDLRQIKTLIDNGAEINKQNCHGNTALHLCLLNTGRFSLMTLDPLSDLRASEKHVQPLQSHTITVNATLLEDYDIAETLIDEGADLNIQNNDGNTPLHLALINSKPSKLVHESNDNKDHLDKQCHEDVKVFKLASKESNVYKLVKKMMDKGVDVCKQNNEGNTSLHLALSSELQHAEAVCKNIFKSTPHPRIVNDNFEMLLQILLGNSNTIYTCNRLGMDPIQMTIASIKRKQMTLDYRLQETSEFKRHLQEIFEVMTIVPLLNLEYHEHFSYSNCHGNSLLHLQMESFQYIYDPSIILRSVDPTYLKFNVQNKAGDTPLHIAREEDVDYILSYCDKVDLFARNKRKETFLHTMFKFKYFDFRYNDIEQILRGQCKYCSKEDVKQLLHCRDIAGNTPLHVLLTHANTIIWSYLIKLFYEAGADLNACNTSKESILHCLVRTGDAKESIKFAIEHGADLNVQNVFGESPIFMAKQIEVVKFLIDSGADLNICNNSGQNLFLSSVYNIRPILYVSDIEYLIQNCSVKVKDIHGNNILHYVAWHGMYRNGKDYYDDVTLLLDAGAEIEPDALGQLPCHIAHQMGHVILARRLCKCDNTEHLDKFTFTKQILVLNIYETLKSIEQDISPFFTYNMKYFACHTITDILERPFIGSVRFEGEAEEIRSCIVNIINEICKRLGHGNDLLENKVIQSGSVGENTKVGLPDEFDFMCVFSILSEACCVETVSKEEPAYATAKLKDEFRGHRCRSLFDENCYLSRDTVFDIFMTALRDIVQYLDIYSHPNIMYKNIINKPQGPNVELYFVWTGRKYKGMKIKVDLVPAIQIKGWWPPGTRLDSLACDTEQIEQLRKDGAVLLFKEIPGNMCQISVYAAEKIHLAGLSREARNAYKVAKILCDERICPRDEPYTGTNITSYMLKNCMFYVLDNPIESVYDRVCKMFRYLIGCAKKKRLLPYVHPHRNIFNKKIDDIINMGLYSQIILNLIGSTEESTDIYELIYEYRRMYLYEHMYSPNSDSEDSEAEDTEDQYIEYNQ